MTKPAQSHHIVTNDASTIKQNQFSKITFNLKADKATIRHDRMEGRDYLVAPCVMLTEGVHNGSMGPLYYPADELAKHPMDWNSRPIVVYHPTQNGQGISASDPVVYDKQKIGVLLNTRFEDKKLKTECWMEEERIRAVDERVLNALENEEMVEVSTGLYTDNEMVEGEWNGETYKAIARNYRADHLAVLPDRQGACSVSDGAGLLRNERAASSGDPKDLQALGASIVSLARGAGRGQGGPRQGDGGTDTCVCPKCGHTVAHERGTPCTNAECPKCGSKMVGEGAVKNAFRAFRSVLDNELSHNDLWAALNQKIRSTTTSGAISESWVIDVYDEYFIYDKGGTTYYQQYSVKDDEVTLIGVRKEATRQTIYKLADGTLVGNASKTEGGSKYPAAAYAYVPDPQKPSTWKLRLWESPEKQVTAAQVGRAIAAIGKGFRGSKVQLPAGAVAKVKARIRAAWRKANPSKASEDMPAVLKNQEVVMNKEQVVNQLIADDSSPWGEDDREMLMGLSDEKVALLLGNVASDAKAKAEAEAAEKKKAEAEAAAATPPAPAPAAPQQNAQAPEAPPAEPTVEQYIAGAPAGIQDMLRAGIVAHNAEKAKLVSVITANKRNVFTAEALNAKGLTELKALATLAQEPAPNAPNAQGAQPTFIGMGEPAPVGNQTIEPLVAPTLNFGKDE